MHLGCLDFPTVREAIFQAEHGLIGEIDYRTIGLPQRFSRNNCERRRIQEPARGSRSCSEHHRSRWLEPILRDCYSLSTFLSSAIALTCGAMKVARNRLARICLFKARRS